MQKIFLLDSERKILSNGSKSNNYYELQFCEKHLPIKKLLNLKNITLNKETSLYAEANSISAIENEITFENCYGEFFFLTNTQDKIDKLDFFGINYYTKEQTICILECIRKTELPDKQIIIDWLTTCVNNYNGFYILGI